MASKLNHQCCAVCIYADGYTKCEKNGGIIYNPYTDGRFCKDYETDHRKLEEEKRDGNT